MYDEELTPKYFATEALFPQQSAASRTSTGRKMNTVGIIEKLL
jgi:hypothetical protein